MKKDYIEKNQKELKEMAKNIMNIEKALQENKISSKEAMDSMTKCFDGIPAENLIEAFDFLDDYILKNLDK